MAGIITATWQTPLSHINVLSQNRGTPNMALRDAWEHEDLREHEDGWVELLVSADFGTSGQTLDCPNPNRLTGQQGE